MNEPIEAAIIDRLGQMIDDGWPHENAVKVLGGHEVARRALVAMGRCVPGPWERAELTAIELAQVQVALRATEGLLRLKLRVLKRAADAPADLCDEIEALFAHHDTLRLAAARKRDGSETPVVPAAVPDKGELR